MNTINLDGEWSLSWNDTGKISFEEALRSQKDGNSISCPVPGAVHMALVDAKVIKEPLEGLNSKECRWMEDKEWWYTKEFDVKNQELKDKSVLTFEGLDLTADVWLNGNYLGGHNNAFIPIEFDVTGILKEGRNAITVRLDDGVYGVKDKSVDFMKLSWNNTQPYRAWMRKPQFCYSWDWTVWLPTVGIWKSVYIKNYEEAYIADVFVRSIFEDGKALNSENVELSITVDIEFVKDGSLTLVCEIFEDSRYDNVINPITTISKKVENCSEQLSDRIENPKLWWPNGSGRPYLYTVKVTILNEAGKEIDVKTFRHGIRSIKLFQWELGQGQKSFTFMINETPIFAKGANWVPADAVLGRVTGEKHKALLQAAAEANLNMMRVWGGGVYASEDYMDTCDELGLMVWHDFMFACAYYPDFDEEFYNNVKHEAITAIKMLRNHASLIGWSGNNEIQEMYLNMKRWRPDAHEFYGGSFYEKLLPGLCRELDPDRIYRESSPYGGEDPAGFDEGDQHVWHFTHRPNFEHYLDIWRFTDFNFKFLSEFGIIGAMNMESTIKCISESGRYPDSEEWLHHTNFSDDGKLLTKFVERYFGPKEELTVQEYILKSQVIQAEIMRHIYDELRSRKFTCSGVLLWTWNDSYGTHNWSVIDYYLGKRPIYYYLKRSLSPLAISWKGYESQTFDAFDHYKEYYRGKVEPLEAYVMNDTLEEKEVELKYYVMTMDGRILKQGGITKSIPENCVRSFQKIDLNEIISLANPEEIFVLAEICSGGILQNENRYFLVPYKNLALLKANVNCSITKLSEKTVELEIGSNNFVWMLHLATPDGVNPKDNDFDLIPGRVKKVIVEIEDVDKFTPQFVSLNPGLELTIK